LQELSVLVTLLIVEVQSEGNMLHKKFKAKRVAFAVFASLCISASASATNGYFSHGFGTQSKAMAGAGVALSLDSLAPATNPAGLLDVGDRRDIGS